MLNKMFPFSAAFIFLSMEQKKTATMVTVDTPYSEISPNVIEGMRQQDWSKESLIACRGM